MTVLTGPLLSSAQSFNLFNLADIKFKIMTIERPAFITSLMKIHSFCKC